MKAKEKDSMKQSFMSRSIFSLLVMTCATALSQTAFADEIFLNDGRVIEGEIISAADADVINIRVGAGGLRAVQHFSRQQIRSIKYGVSSAQMKNEQLRNKYAELEKNEAATAQAWWELAEQLQNDKATALAKEAAVQVVQRDRDHAEARRLLGHTKYKGVWMRPSEAATARGEVFFRGQWVAWQVQQQILQDEAQRREDALAARKERDEVRRQRLAAAAESSSSSFLLPPPLYTSSYYRSPYYNPTGAWRYPILYGPTHFHTPHCTTSSGSGWNISASGGGSHTAWSFNWSGGSLFP
jgi:hypothetical protein